MRILPTNPVERKAAQAILTHALLRWETQAGVFVAVAALVILPDPWKPVAVLGLAVAVWSVLRSLGDASLNAQVALGALETDVRISELTTPSYQALLNEALENDRRIRQLLLGLKEGPLKAQAEMRVADIDGWIRNMYAFARGSEELRRQGAFAEDLRALPEEIRALEWRLGHSTEDSTVAKETLEKKRQTLAALTEVNRSLERADDELRDAAAAIENIYGQLLRMTTARQLPQEAVNRLSAEVEDRAASMKVMADALTATLQGYRRPTD
jgi:hypothetical protein